MGYTVTPFDGHAQGDRVVDIILDAWKTDDLWEPTNRNVTREAQHKWMKDIFIEGFSGPNYHYFGVKDESGKIIAWTCLQYAGPQSEKEKEMASGKILPPPAPGMHEGLMKEMFAFLGCAAPYGYDPEKDFHRRGTMVDPDYQRRGLGTLLTKYCNKIADEAGARTFVPARPSSKHMFEQCGFVVLDEFPIDMKKYPDIEDNHVAENWLLVREAQKP
ncbi:hypothetical protein NA57DRAFT_80402 [Rhizodiscina lignyota]|uniref:N-acetyltransferase domain-containing protein n=1 Tax=Rhizodiscina lignyota TaxID=1504668 RepID=A0A9P4M2F9_9PEZI|nr:hypothetical protein NA57DRAFT_80402 [Rhizodiscina lignyota]